MRHSISRLAIGILGCVLAAACTSAASPSPTPSSSTRAAVPSAAPSPTPPPRPSERPANVAPAQGQIAAGSEHTCAITDSDGVACWGSNGSGQLGSGSTADSPAPVDVVGLESSVAAIAAGGSHTCALTAAGGVKCWGYNEYGQLGNGSNTNSALAVEVSGLSSGVTTISVGWSHSCAVTSSGSVQCWGHNHFGWLGDGTTTDSSIPVDVRGLDRGVTAVAAGHLHTCALKSTGAVACWGYGQAEDPETVQSSVPVDRAGLSNVAAIGASLDRTCAALTGTGDVTCWGPYYRYGIVPPTQDGIDAVDVSRLAGGVTAIVVGEAHACVLSGTGRVACWGYDGNGQLGRGITSPASVREPLEVSGLGGVTSVAVGGFHTCAQAADGAVSCWGSNTHGQLGSTTGCSSTSVPQVVPMNGVVPASPSSSLPTGRIDHATGPTDVVLRYDHGPDVGISELGGDQFMPGPEFTLYGNGTAIYRNDAADAPLVDGPIVRGDPFTVARLDDAQVQSLLSFALGEGGLAGACERYETGDLDVSDSHTISVRAGGIAKRVDAGGPSPLGPLLDRLRTFEPGNGAETKDWVPDRYWGSLFEAAAAIDSDIIPDTREAGSSAWPWAYIQPADFVGRDEGGWIGLPRRIMMPAEAAVLGLLSDGGVVRRTYLIGPDGETVYAFSLWPMLPDEMGS